jgi:hypothetical protein
VVLVGVAANVTRELRAALHAEAAQHGVTLSQLIVAKLQEPVRKGRLCHTCAARPKKRQREFNEQRL